MHILSLNNTGDGFNYNSDGNQLSIDGQHYRPYDLTYGAISGCLMSTLMGIIKQHNVSIYQFNLMIDGVKRDTIPTTLKQITINATIETNASQQEMQDYFNQAMNTCSMVQTFMNVAQFDTSLTVITK